MNINNTRSVVGIKEGKQEEDDRPEVLQIVQDKKAIKDFCGVMLRTVSESYRNKRYNWVLRLVAEYLPPVDIRDLRLVSRNMARELFCCLQKDNAIYLNVNTLNDSSISGALMKVKGSKSQTKMRLVLNLSELKTWDQGSKDAKYQLENVLTEKDTLSKISHLTVIDDIGKSQGSMGNYCCTGTIQKVLNQLPGLVHFDLRVGYTICEGDSLAHGNLRYLKLNSYNAIYNFDFPNLREMEIEKMYLVRKNQNGPVFSSSMKSCEKLTSIKINKWINVYPRSAGSKFSEGFMSRKQYFERKKKESMSRLTVFLIQDLPEGLKLLTLPKGMPVVLKGLPETTKVVWVNQQAQNAVQKKVAVAYNMAASMTTFSVGVMMQVVAGLVRALKGLQMTAQAWAQLQVLMNQLDVAFNRNPELRFLGFVMLLGMYWSFMGW